MRENIDRGCKFCKFLIEINQSVKVTYLIGL